MGANTEHGGQLGPKNDLSIKIYPMFAQSCVSCKSSPTAGFFLNIHFFTPLAFPFLFFLYLLHSRQSPLLPFHSAHHPLLISLCGHIALIQTCLSLFFFLLVSVFFSVWLHLLPYLFILSKLCYLFSLSPPICLSP